MVVIEANSKSELQNILLNNVISYVYNLSVGNEQLKKQKVN